jgi:hypothetical protein
MVLCCAKTKSDLVVMPSERQIFAFFALRMTTEPKIPGAVIPRRVFTQPGSKREATKRKALHDWTSHAADAFAYLALTIDSGGDPAFHRKKK